MSGQPIIGHQAIAASAGSGKTYQLAHRYIRLLAVGAKPDRIAALTFSRKAAGEIFDSVVRYLCQATLSTEQAARTAERIGRPGLGQQDFLGLLREVLDAMPRLHVGTLDSFIVGVISAFPVELGIYANLQLMENDSPAALGVRQQVLSRIFDRTYGDTGDQRQFLEAFRRATFGSEEKGIERSLDKFIGVYEASYQALPWEHNWGHEVAIWPNGSPWMVPSGDVAVAADELEALLAQEGLSERATQRWMDFINGVRNFGPGSPLSREIEFLFEKLMEEVEGLRCGSATISMDRVKFDLSPEQCRLALALIAHVMKTELSAALEKTQGIYRVLNQYEQLYDRVARQNGVLTFTDAQYLLTAANDYSRGAVISRAPSQEARLYIDYRLDCQLDHWLLDEFQDTSDLQWEVLSNLADEILQDDSGERSLFYVGDVKQAIYGWRGGNARLFGNILEKYGPLIEQSPLSTSFRSCQPVIDTVNLVFGHLQGAGLRQNAVDEWQGIWQEHQCEKGAVPDTGYVALLEPPSEGGTIKPDEQARYRVVARLLDEIEPLKRGLSAAVLVRSNKSGREAVDFLRGQCPDMNVVHEGRASIEDNPVVALMLSLVRFAAHPGDSMAWRHLQMSPLQRYLTEAGLGRDSLPLLLLRQIQTEGFRAFVRRWGERLEKAQPLDAFGRKRLNDLTSAAGEFDRTGGHDCNAFLRFIDNYEINELAAADAIRVMTVHQSKGLGFDIVILPDLQPGSMNGGGQLGLAMGRHPEPSLPVWALEMPRRVIAENDPVLAAQVADADDKDCFEELCVLYVAMTRAKQGLYIVTSFPGKTSAALTAGALLKSQLCGDPKPVDGQRVKLSGEEFVCLYQAGEAAWFEGVAATVQAGEIVPIPELPPDFSKRPSLRQRLVRVSPSEQARGEQRADVLFAPDRGEGLDLGAAIHELFEKVSWMEEVDVEALIDEWRESTRFQDHLKEQAVKHFQQALASDEIRATLSRPPGNAELWRERPFEVVLGDRWVTGVFDRVVIAKDSSGRAVQAEIIDFKSDDVISDDEIVGEAKRYAPQMSLYGSALSHMLQLGPPRIGLRLVFTNPGKVHVLG